jgi:rRNA-processing protein FCF1
LNSTVEKKKKKKIHRRSIRAPRMGKLARRKQIRKGLRYYAQHHGMGEPYRVLLEQEFVLRCTAQRRSIRDDVPEVLQCKARVEVTRCLVASLRNLAAQDLKEHGDDYDSVPERAAVTCKRYQHAGQCRHELALDACDCIIQLAKSGKFLVAASSPDVIKVLRRLPAVPVLTLSAGGLFSLLEPAYSAVARTKRRTDKAMLGISEQEMRIVERAQREQSKLIASVEASEERRKRAQFGAHYVMDVHRLPRRKRAVPDSGVVANVADAKKQKVVEGDETPPNEEALGVPDVASTPAVRQRRRKRMRKGRRHQRHRRNHPIAVKDVDHQVDQVDQEKEEK